MSNLTPQVGGYSFKAADRHRFFLNSTTSAGGLTGPVTGASQYAGKHITVPVEHISIVVTLGGNQPDIFRHIGMRGTGVLTINYLLDVFGISDVASFHCIFTRDIVVLFEEPICSDGMKPHNN